MIGYDQMSLQDKRNMKTVTIANLKLAHQSGSYYKIKGDGT